ncbi:MAG TPA: helix-turn-helix domain-containing protein [Desulfuromonadaceae bacterium]
MRKERRLLTVRAAEKTLELLEMLVAGTERLTIRDVAVKLGISRNEALLLFVTLESRGMVRWDEQAKVYRPGRRSAEVARQLVDLFGLARAEAKTAVPPRAVPVAVTRKLRPDRRLDAGGVAARAS